MPTFDPGTIRTKQRPIVSVKASWSDNWQEQPDLICTSISYELFAIGRATFRYHHGCMIKRGEHTQSKVYRQDFRNHWIMVELQPEDSEHPPDYWFGIVTSQQRSMHGIDNEVAAGDVLVVAHSPEYLLTRVQVTKSYVENGTDELTKVGYGITFNDLSKGRTDETGFQANMTPVGGVLGFTASYADADPWTAGDICEYLLLEVLPKHMSDGPSFSVGTFPLGTYKPIAVPSHGRTIYDIINDVVDRRRGLSWCLEPIPPLDETTPGFELKVKQLNGYDIELPDGSELLSNPNKLTIDLAGSRDVLEAVETSDYMTQYNRIVVEGAPMGAVYTASRTQQGGTLVRNWTDDQVVAYENGASAAAGYNLLDISEQKTRNDKIRTSDDLSRVWTSFKVDEERAAYSQTLCIFPVLEEWDKKPRSDSTNIQKLYYPLLRFEPMLPLLEGIDYSSSSTSPPNSNPPGSVPKYRKPFPVAITQDFKVIALDGSEVAAGMDEMLGDAGFKVSCSVEVSDTEFAFTLHPNNLPHVLTNYAPYNGTTYATSHLEYGFIDNQKISCTLYARATENIRVSYPENELGEQDVINNLHQEMIIRLGESARFDWIVEGTIIGIDEDGAPKTAPSDRVLRDDRPRMMTIARLAWEWYRRPRKALSLRWSQVLPYYEIRIGQLIERLAWSTVPESDVGFIATLDGDLLVTLGDEQLVILGSSTPGVGEISEDSWITLDGEPIEPLGSDDELAILGEPVNTIISSVMYDFEHGETTISTQFGEIDFATLGAV